jgi:hypothetical protein
MGKIFISYRREDNRDFVERIADHLKDRFGKKVIFQDVESIAVGDDWKNRIRNAIENSDIEIVIIGQRWFASSDDVGIRRPDHDDDPVRIEVEAALKYGIPIIPVLIDGASMPREANLPTTIAKLAAINASSVRRNPDFESDMRTLVHAIQEKRLTTGRRVQRNVQSYVIGHSIIIKRAATAAIAAVVLAMLIGWTVGHSVFSGTPTPTVSPGPGRVSPSARIVTTWSPSHRGYLVVTLSGFSPGTYLLYCHYLGAKNVPARITRFTATVYSDPQTLDNGKTCNSEQDGDSVWVSYDLYESLQIPAEVAVSSATTTPLSSVTPTSGAFETVGPDSGSGTFTDYTHANGNLGQRIASYQTIRVSCRLTGFTTADGNPWWYRVASSPWNNAYYAPADNFYNNGATSGSLIGTPFVDTNVPLC